MKRHISGVLLTLGPIIVILGVLFLIPTQFFDTSELSAQAASIRENRTPWTIAWLLIGTGALVVAGGLSTLVKHFNESTANRWVGRSAYLASAMAVLGALFYATIALMGVILSPETFVTGLASYLTFLAVLYAVLTLLAVFIFGVLLFLGGRKIPGILMILFPIFIVVTGSYQLPALNYFPIFILGISLLVRPFERAG